MCRCCRNSQEKYGNWKMGIKHSTKKLKKQTNKKTRVTSETDRLK